MIKPFLFSLLFSIPIFAFPNQPVDFAIHKIVTGTVTKPASYKPKKKFRWKHIFRPFKIFKKRLSFWWLLFFGITTFLGTTFFLLDKSSIDLEGGFVEAIFYLLAGILGISAILTVLILVALPIIVIFRIIKELKWRKRYEKCAR